MASERQNFLIVQQFVNFQVEQAENDAALVNIVKMRRQRKKARPEKMLGPTMVRCGKKTSVWSLPPPNA